MKMRMPSNCIMLFFLSSELSIASLSPIGHATYVVTFPKQFVSVTLQGFLDLYTCEQHVSYFECNSLSPF